MLAVGRLGQGSAAVVDVWYGVKVISNVLVSEGKSYREFVEAWVNCCGYVMDCRSEVAAIGGSYLTAVLSGDGLLILYSRWWFDIVTRVVCGMSKCCAV